MIKNSKRIYILGNVGCGKTTLSSKLSLKMKIPFYELDNVVWEYHEGGDIKRNDEEIEKLFLNIIDTPQWIIEDVGRDKFIDYLNGYGDIPPSDVLKFYLEDGSWYAIRPSGTEPKIKIYLYTKGSTSEKADKNLANMEKVILDMLNSIK